jgi:formylglycine-generating enzyme required for sulfatase activity
MTGNVWEWTLSSYMDYPYRHDARHDPEIETVRVLRGGALNLSRRGARVSCRDHYHPDHFYDDSGLRVVVGPILPPYR